MPIGKKIITSNTSKSIAKSVGRSLKDAAVGTAVDVLQGKSVEEAAKENLNTTKRKIANAVKIHSKQLTKNKKRRMYAPKKNNRKKENYFLLK